MFLHRLLQRPAIATVIRGALRYIFGKRGRRLVQGLRLFYRVRVRVVLHTPQPIGTFARIPDVRVWVDGAEAFPRIEKLIRLARHSIVIQMFIWKDDEVGRLIAQRLVEAADRGVQVDITKEAVGDLFEFGRDFLSTQRSSYTCWKRFWSHPRIRISYGTQRDHAKVYVFDDQTLLLSGMNIAREYRYTWHDYLIELRGTAFVEQYLTRKPGDRASNVRIVMNTEDGAPMRSVLMQLLRGARESVVVEHSYISDPEVVDAFIAITKRRIPLTVIFPERPDFHHHANMASVGRLLTDADSSYLRVLVYPGMVHAKIILVDFRRAFVGSANLMRSSLDDMGEVNVYIEGKHRALWKLQETLRMDILRSRSLSSPPPLLWISRWLAWLGL